MEKIVTAVSPKSLPRASRGYFWEEIDPMPHTCHKGYLDDTSDPPESSTLVISEVPFLTAAWDVCGWPLTPGSSH